MVRILSEDDGSSEGWTTQGYLLWTDDGSVILHDPEQPL